MTEDPLTRVRRICLALPEATEKLAWGAPTFRIRDKKMFATFDDHHYGAEQISLWCHAPVGAQAVLTASEPELFFVPPYVGKKGWIGVILSTTSDARLAACVRAAYCMVAPKKLQALLDPPD